MIETQNAKQNTTPKITQTQEIITKKTNFMKPKYNTLIKIQKIPKKKQNKFNEMKYVTHSKKQTMNPCTDHETNKQTIEK